MVAVTRAGCVNGGANSGNNFRSTLGEDFLQYLRHERGQRQATFLFAILAGRSKVCAMSVEQLEATLLKLPSAERTAFASWFDAHRHELIADDLSDAQKTELLRRRREYDEHPEHFVRMNKKSLDQMFNRIRKNVAARLSSAR
jgi:hypothetical protein